MSRAFPVGVVVSVYRDRLLCSFDEYRDFLNYMTSERVSLHDVAAARRAVAPVLARRIPGLANIPDLPEKTDSGNSGRYAKACAKSLGCETITLDRMKRGIFKPRTIQEFTEELMA